MRHSHSSVRPRAPAVDGSPPRGHPPTRGAAPTEARFRDALEAQLDEFEAVDVPGWFSTTICESDDNPNELWMAVVFESRGAYRANAESPEREAWHQALSGARE